MGKASSKKLQVLHIVPELKKCGGMESFVMSYYEELYGDVEFHFAVFGDVDKERSLEVEKLHGKVTKFGKINLKDISGVREKFDLFLSKNNFDAVHCHMANAAFIFLPVAKKHGIKVRIIHSHQNKYADKISHAIRNYPLVKLGLRYATHFLACSQEAGDFLFKKRKYHIVKNAISAKTFAFNSDARAKIRKKLGVNDDTLLISHNGRFVPQKNHAFIIKCFYEVYKKQQNAKLLFMGDGYLMDQVREQVKSLNIEKNVIFAGSVDNVNELMSASDVFIFPSKYEGVGIACIEAQCSGLPVVASNYVPKESCIIESLIQYMNLGDPEKWADALISASKIDNDRDRAFGQLKDKGYDIHISARELLRMYYSFLKEAE